MTLSSDIRRQVREVLDYLQDSQLALYANPVASSPTRVTWQSYEPGGGLSWDADHATLSDYLRWVASGSYSAVLADGSLVQLTYDMQGGQVTAHRLAYIPCPVVMDLALIEEGQPIADVVALYEHAADVALRSPLRFDFDASAANVGHPAAHFTFNSARCRIACAAPMHVRRFVDFVYKHFYPDLWLAHSPFFATAAHSHVGAPTLTEADRDGIHIAWDARRTAAGRAPDRAVSHRKNKPSKRGRRL
jgi:hypothetical protein